MSKIGWFREREKNTPAWLPYAVLVEKKNKD